MAGLKKALMLLVWRFQQVNSMIIIIGLSMTLTLQLYPYMKWRFINLGIPARLDWLIILIMFILIFAAAVVCGMIYDSFLKLWIPQQIVTIERQPYAKGKIAAKGIINRKYFYNPMLRAAGLRTEAIFDAKWVERNLEIDPILNKDVDRITAWVAQYELKPADKRWLEDVETILKKPYAPKKEDHIK